MGKFTKEHIENLRKAHLGKKLSPEHRRKVIQTLRPLKKGQTYEEVFGDKIAKLMKHKMRLAKLGKKRPFVPRPSIRGKNHYNWKGGITDVKHSMRDSHEWKSWRTQVFERDNYICQDCGVHGGKLEPHHIIPLREMLSRAFDVGNGITLCRPCHLKIVGKEKLFADRYLHLANRC